MNVVDFVNSRAIGHVRKNRGSSINQRACMPNLDNVVSRLACQKKDVYISAGETGHVPPFACKFRKDNNLDLLAVANEDGEVMLIDSGKLKDTISSFTAHHNAIYDICWLPNKYQLITVSGDHRACLWDLNTFKMIGSFKKHLESIKSVDVCPNSNDIFATGSRDGSICVWDVREKCNECGNSEDKPTHHIQSAHRRRITNQKKTKKKLSAKESFSSVSAVAFQDLYNLASAGAADGVVKIWDLRKTHITTKPAPRCEMKYMDGQNNGHGCTSLIFDSHYKKLYACSTANKIFMFDCHAYNNAKVAYEGFRCDTYFIKLALSADNQYLACGSSDRKAFVWKTSQPGLPKWEFVNHTSEVSAVAWGSCDVTKFVTCGDDNIVTIWKTRSNEETETSESKYLAAAAPYSPCDVPPITDLHSSRFSHSLPSTPSVVNRNISPNITKTPVMKSIRSFFAPVSSSSPSSSLDSSTTPSSSQSIRTRISPVQITGSNFKSPVEQICSNIKSPDIQASSNLKSPLEQASSSVSPEKLICSSIISPIQSTSSCVLSPELVLSPSKKINRDNYLSFDAIILLNKSQGKENLFGHCSSDHSNVQMKRKSPIDSTPEIHKNSKKGKRSKTSVKKQPSSEGTITNYFTLSPKEDHL